MFAYSTGVSYGLGQILARVSDQRFYDYINTHLFVPLGIQKVNTWLMQGDAHAGSSLYLTMRGMAKLGQMYLDGGRWQEQQIVPQSWVVESTTQVLQQDTIRYAYQWWLTDFVPNGQGVPSYYASGWGGQSIFVLPTLNSVVIVTGHRYEDGDAQETSVRSMMNNYILPFVMGS